MATSVKENICFNFYERELKKLQDILTRLRMNTSKKQLQHGKESDFANELESELSYLQRVAWSVVQTKKDLGENSMNLSSRLKNTFDVN